MSYVSIWKPVNDRIVEAAIDSENEIIGLLLGRFDSDTIIIEDSITGEYSADANRVILPSQTLAKIADDLVNGRVKGNVVGWYHSHTEGGLFFSGTDSQTQKKLQQFSSLVVGIVVDAATGAVGYYRVDPQTGKPIRLPDARIRIYEEPAAAIPPEAQARPPAQLTPIIKTRRTPTQLRLPSRTLILAAIIITLVATVVLTGAMLYRNTTAAPTLTIGHTPIMTANIGTPIEVKAGVTGPAQVVKLFYGVTRSGALAAVDMNAPAPGQYSYTIPGDQVTGGITYYIETADASGNYVRSNSYQIQIADFRLIATNTTFTVYRTKSMISELSVLRINGFNESLTLASSGQSSGISIGFSQNPVPSTITSINMIVLATQQAAEGTYTFTVAATFLPSNATPVMRQTTITVTVTDFDLQVTPGLRQLNAGGTTTYQLTLTIGQGFADRVNVSLRDLPSGATATLSTTGSTLGLGPGTTTITLQITTTSSVKSGTYTLTVLASGGGVVHSQMVQLTVR